jgi:GT2 family glycosyltransferase
MVIQQSLPDAAIVIPNWNGKHHLDGCFESLGRLAYPGEVEIVLVDNGSVDGSVEHTRRRFPRVKIVQNPENTGFAPACNQGADAVRTPIVAFLNNDMRVEPSWLTELVRPIVAGEAKCTGSLILSWDGTAVNYGGGGMNFHGIGCQFGIDDPDIEKFKQKGDTLFACGGAMAIDRKLHLECGGFDNDFFAYYEDVDLGWRLWVIGERVLYVPSSVCYHHHSATSRRVDVHRLRLLQIRNPLFAIFKNYDDENLRRVLPAALMLTLRRTKYLLALHEDEFTMLGNRGLETGFFADLKVRGRAKLASKSVRMAGLADVLAINEFTSSLPVMRKKRNWIQAHRKRTDVEIAKLFRAPYWTAEGTQDYADVQKELVDLFGLDSLFGKCDK